MEIFILFLALAIFVGLFVLLFKWVKKQNLKKVKLFADFAEKHRLQHASSKYMMAHLNNISGQIGSSSISINEKMVGSGKNQTVVTTLIISPNPFDFEFRIGKEHLFSKAGKLLGFKDVNFNDAEFDKTFLIKSKEEDKVKALINYEIQSELTRITKDLRGTIVADANAISYAVTGPLLKQDHIDSYENVMLLILKMVNGRR